MPRRRSPRNAWLVLLLLLSAACDAGPSPTRAPEPPEGGIRARVVRVVDGDTIRVDLQGLEERVRYIGIDTPERDRPFGHEATRANAALVQDATVELRFDVERRDRYGRLLAYVHLDDGSMVNARLLELGFAQVMTVPPNVRHQARFLALERGARDGNRGLWGR